MESLFDEASKGFAQKRFRDAAVIYKQICESETVSAADLVRALCNRSACLTNMGDFEGSLADAERAAGLTEGPRPCERAAAALEGLLRLEEALEQYKKAIAKGGSADTINPHIERISKSILEGKGVPSKTSLDRYYFDKSLSKGKEAMSSSPLEAARHFTRAIELCPEIEDIPVLYCNRSAAYFRARSFEQSLADAQCAVRAKTDYLRGHIRILLALEALGRMVEARDIAKIVVKVDPANDDVKRILDQPHIPTATEGHVPEKSAATNADVSAHKASVHHLSTSNYCRYCSEYGHNRSTCPHRKRPRE